MTESVGETLAIDLLDIFYKIPIIHFILIKDIGLHSELLNLVRKSTLYTKITLSKKNFVWKLSFKQTTFIFVATVYSKNYTHIGALIVLQKPSYFKYNSYAV